MEDDIECDPLGEVFCDLDGNKFYTSLKVKGLHVHLGSFVKVILESDDDSNDLDSHGYCQILSIFDKVSKESDDGVVTIEVRWFSKPCEVTRVKKIGIELSENELVETDHTDDIPAGAICEVIYIDGVNDNNNKKKSIKNTTTTTNIIKPFTCRFMETSETNAILKINVRSIFDRGMKLSEYTHAYLSHLETCTDIDASKSDEFSRAIRQLHISVLPESLPCRSKERELIETHITNGLKTSGATKPIYISGMPGTGKTATVLSTIAALKKNGYDLGGLPTFEFVEINCLRLAAPADAYSALWRAINGTHLSAAKALQKLNDYFGRASSIYDKDRPMTVCLVDEIDFLITRDEHIIYNFFTWPTFDKSSLIVIGIANTMNLPERLSTRVSSRLVASLNRISYGPYSHDQVQEILKNRLSELHSRFFDQNMIELLARKASSVAGDLRTALKICQRSIEIFRDERVINNDGKVTPDKVNSDIIIRATNEYRESPMLVTVKNACLLDKAIMITICKNYNTNGETDTMLHELWDRLLDFFSLSYNDPLIKLHKPPYFIFEEALERLIHQGIVKRSYSRGHSGSRIAKLSSRIEISDVRSALKDDAMLKYGGFSITGAQDI